MTLATATLIYNEESHKRDEREGVISATYDEDIDLSGLLKRLGTRPSKREQVMLIQDNEEHPLGPDDQFSPQEGDVTLVMRRIAA